MSGISSEIQSVAGALQIEVARADAAVANPKQSPRRIIITVTRARTRRRIAPKPHPSNGHRAVVSPSWPSAIGPRWDVGVSNPGEP
jgi:hypothetical protein